MQDIRWSKSRKSTEDKMQLNIDISLIIGLMGIVGSVIAYVTAANKLRFEVDSLKEQNKKQFDLIDQNRKDIMSVREKGSIHSEGLEARVEKLEQKMKDIDEKLSIMNSDMKGVLTKLDFIIETKTQKRSKAVV